MINQTPSLINSNVHEFFIFNRSGVCVFHIDFSEKSIMNKAISIDKLLEHRYKLIFGLLFSMKSFVKNLSPARNVDLLKNFATMDYKLHYVEFLNGLRFVLITMPSKTDFTTQLKELFSIFYVNLITKSIYLNKDEAIKNELFLEGVYNYLNSFNGTSL